MFHFVSLAFSRKVLPKRPHLKEAECEGEATLLKVKHRGHLNSIGFPLGEDGKLMFALASPYTTSK